MKHHVKASYFTDMLCIWAYVSQVRIEELQRRFGLRVEIEYPFIQLFGDTRQRVGNARKDKGGYEAAALNYVKVARQFPHIKIHPDVWRVCRPRSSANTHLFLNAVQLLEQDKLISTTRNADSGRTLFEELGSRMRNAFFANARDISDMGTLYEIADSLGIPTDEIRRRINNGAAMAIFTHDMVLKEKYKLQGSPTLVLNDGRQKLYGNVGYLILEANVNELLKNPHSGVSWC